MFNKHCRKLNRHKAGRRPSASLCQTHGSICLKTASLLILSLVLLLVGCDNQGKTDAANGSVIFCLDEDGESLEKEPLSLTATTTIGQIDEILDTFQNQVPTDPHQKLLPDSLSVISRSLEDQLLSINFSKEYLQMSTPREVLVRCGIVRTLVQLDGVQKVSFFVDGEPLTDSRDRKIGFMTAETFIENSGREINNYRSATISLFYASEDGNRLRRESRLIYYPSSQPFEWAIVERIINGPKVQGNYPSVPANTQIISASTSEGICYINLGAQFASEMPGVNPRVSIYSIVNTLIEDLGVDSVQISIAGENDVLYCGAIPLNQPFTADMSLVEN